MGLESAVKLSRAFLLPPLLPTDSLSFSKYPSEEGKSKFGFVSVTVSLSKNWSFNSLFLSLPAEWKVGAEGSA